MNIQDCYVSFVNLDKRPDRLAHMESQLGRVGLHAVRTPGLSPAEVINNGISTPFKGQTMLKGTEGALGCHYAQVSIMEKALELNKTAFVMEDDIHFSSDFNKRLNYIFNWTDTHEWDVIWLGASFHVPPYWHNIGGSVDRRNDCSANLGYDCETTDDPRMIRTYGAFATFAYLVNAKSLSKVLALLDQNVHTSIGIDWLFIKLAPQLKCFSFVPGCIKQIDSDSNISEGVRVWSGFLKLNGTYENSAYVYQERMEDFSPENFKWK